MTWLFVGFIEPMAKQNAQKKPEGLGSTTPRMGDVISIISLLFIYIYTPLLDLPSYLYNTIRSLLHPIIPTLTSNEFLSLPSPFRSSPRTKKEWFGGVDTRIPGIFDEAWLSETGTSTGTRMVMVFVFHCHSWIWMTLCMDVEIGIYSDYCNIIYIYAVYIYILYNIYIYGNRMIFDGRWRLFFPSQNWENM